VIWFCIFVVDKHYFQEHDNPALVPDEEMQQTIDASPINPEVSVIVVGRFCSCSVLDFYCA